MIIIKRRDRENQPREDIFRTESAETNTLILGRNNPPAPSTPTAMRPFLLSHKILPGFPLILILNHAVAHRDPLLSLLLDHAADADDFLAKVPGLLLVPVAQVMRRVIGFAVNLHFYILSGKTVPAPPALDTLRPLTDSCPQPTEIRAVARAPGPYAAVGGILATEGLTAMVAEPDCGVA